MGKLIQVKRSGIEGYGLFARKRIPKGMSIVEYTGEKVSKGEAERRSKDNDKVFLFELNDKYDIDGASNGNEAKYINHSCRPNCESVNYDDKEIWIEAIRDIEEGEELTYDYCIEGFECNCGHCS